MAPHFSRGVAVSWLRERWWRFVVLSRWERFSYGMQMLIWAAMVCVVLLLIFGDPWGSHNRAPTEAPFQHEVVVR